jgi:hypothetical protein
MISEMVNAFSAISVWMDFTVMNTEANIRYLGSSVSEQEAGRGRATYIMMNAQK